MSFLTLSLGAQEIVFDGVLTNITITDENKQNVIVSENGNVFVYDRGFIETFVAINVEVPHVADGSFATQVDVRNFITNVANGKANVLTLAPAHDQNLGSGDGVSINVRYWGQTLKQNESRFHLYKYDFLFRKEL